MKKINVLLSTFFGYGYLTKIPGTVTSAVTTVFIYIAYEILGYTDLKFSIIFFILLFFYSFYAVKDSESEFKNIRSPNMLRPIIFNMEIDNYYINNLDINLICEQPKVSKYRDKIIKSLSILLNIDKELINLKGKTVEKLGLIGKEKAIACEVICSITQ